MTDKTEVVLLLLNVGRRIHKTLRKKARLYALKFFSLPHVTKLSHRVDS